MHVLLEVLDAKFTSRNDLITLVAYFLANVIQALSYFLLDKLQIAVDLSLPGQIQSAFKTYNCKKKLKMGVSRPYHELHYKGSPTACLKYKLKLSSNLNP